MKAIDKIYEVTIDQRRCWMIYFGDGTAYIQRRELLTASESPFGLQEEIILSLCNKLAQGKKSEGQS